MIILGIDPGVAKMGYGVIKKIKGSIECLAYGVIETDPSLPPEKRLNKIYLNLIKLINLYKPSLLVVERVYFFKNLKTALPVSEAKGIVLLAAARKKVAIKQITPLQVKMGVTGYGRADKKQIQKLVKEILKMEELPKPDDAADALAAAICASQCLSISMP